MNIVELWETKVADIIDNLNRLKENFKYYGFVGTFRMFDFIDILKSPFCSLAKPGEVLYDADVKPFKLPDNGVTIWGQKTLQADKSVLNKAK